MALELNDLTFDSTFFKLELRGCEVISSKGQQELTKKILGYPRESPILALKKKIDFVKSCPPLLKTGIKGILFLVC